MKINLSSIIKIVVTLAILIFLLWKVEFNTVGFGDTLRAVRTGYFLLSLLGVIFVLGIKSYRWRLLIQNEGASYSAYKGFAAYMASDAVGIVTPGRIGEIARLYYLREESDISFYSAFKTIVSDRIFDFTMLGWFGLSGMMFYFKTFGDHSGLYYALGVLVLVVLAYFVTIRFLAFILRYKKVSRLPVIRFVYESFLAVTRKQALRMWVITILAYSMYFGFSWLIMISLHLTPSYMDVVFIMSISSLITIIPLSVAGFGTR